MKAVIDHFGSNVRTKPVGEHQFRATVNVCPSPTFYRWIFGWGGKLLIESPESVKEHYQKLLTEELTRYSK